MPALGLLLAGLAACAFPDVDYADGGGGGVSTSASGAGGACPGLAACTAAAASCAAMANAEHATCAQACKDPGCTMKCDDSQKSALTACTTTCMVCAPGCASGPPACGAAAGP